MRCAGGIRLLFFFFLLRGKTRHDLYTNVSLTEVETLPASVVIVRLRSHEDKSESHTLKYSIRPESNPIGEHGGSCRCSPNDNTSARSVVGEYLHSYRARPSARERFRAFVHLLGRLRPGERLAFACLYSGVRRAREEIGRGRKGTTFASLFREARETGDAKRRKQMG